MLKDEWTSAIHIVGSPQSMGLIEPMLFDDLGYGDNVMSQMGWDAASAALWQGGLTRPKTADSGQTLLRKPEIDAANGKWAWSEPEPEPEEPSDYAPTLNFTNTNESDSEYEQPSDYAPTFSFGDGSASSNTGGTSSTPEPEELSDFLQMFISGYNSANSNTGSTPSTPEPEPEPEEPSDYAPTLDFSNTSGNPDAGNAPSPPEAEPESGAASEYEQPSDYAPTLDFSNTSGNPDAGNVSSPPEAEPESGAASEYEQPSDYAPTLDFNNTNEPDSESLSPGSNTTPSEDLPFENTALPENTSGNLSSEGAPVSPNAQLLQQPSDSIPGAGSNSGSVNQPGSELPSQLSGNLATPEGTESFSDSPASSYSSGVSVYYSGANHTHNSPAAEDKTEPLNQNSAYTSSWTNVSHTPKYPTENPFAERVEAEAQAAMKQYAYKDPSPEDYDAAYREYNRLRREDAMKDKTQYSGKLYRYTKSWYSRTEGDDYRGLDNFTMTNNLTKKSTTIKVQSVANNKDFPLGNTVAVDFDFIAYSESNVSNYKVLLVANTETVSETKIGSRGHELDSEGKEVFSARWLGHEGYPSSGGCIIPATEDDFNTVKQYMADEGITDGTTIPVKLTEEWIERYKK